jgi:hypothetical protein
MNPVTPVSGIFDCSVIFTILQMRLGPAFGVAEEFFISKPLNHYQTIDVMYVSQPGDYYIIASAQSAVIASSLSPAWVY